MAVPDPAEKWASAIREVTVGATKEEGGTRAGKVTIGGHSGIPFLSYECECPNRPAIAVDVLDIYPDDWPETLKEPYGEALKSPGEWARKAVEFGAEIINLRLRGTHPDFGDRSADDALKVVKEVMEAVDVPLSIWGCEVTEKDQVVMPKVADATKGENCLLGSVREEDYRTLTAAALASKHKLIALSPIDINKAKQVNILVTEMGYPLEDIVMYPTTAGLGYGMEYVYSIMERARLAALTGDKLMQMPVVVDVGYEAWRAKEAKAPDSEPAAAEWGPQTERGPAWEMITATNLLQAGADLIIMRHPKAIEVVRKTADDLVG